MDAREIAEAASAHGRVAGVLAAEPAEGERVFLVALGEDETLRWIALHADGAPVGEREIVRAVASLVAMCELAAELAGREDEERVASPAYLDEVGTAALGASTGAVQAFVADVLERYALPLR